MTEVPYILLSSLKRKINNIATFRLSDRVNILGNKISSLKTVEWRIIGQYKNEYKINYRLRPNQDWQELTANITTIDPRFPENAHPLNAPSQQYYKFSYIDTITNGSKESDLEYWVVSVVADIRNSKNKISYHKWVNNKEEKINTKVVDDSYVITHKVPSIEKQKPISVSQGELEEKESN